MPAFSPTFCAIKVILKKKWKRKPIACDVYDSSKAFRGYLSFNEISEYKTQCNNRSSTAYSVYELWGIDPLRVQMLWELESKDLEILFLHLNTSRDPKDQHMLLVRSTVCVNLTLEGKDMELFFFPRFNVMGIKSNRFSWYISGRAPHCLSLIQKVQCSKIWSYMLRVRKLFKSHRFFFLSFNFIFESIVF